jgi:hypothetical protein
LISMMKGNGGDDYDDESENDGAAGNGDSL